jgi:ABC-type glutathione transport system ATPase component
MTRHIRAAVLEVASAGYVRTARSKGLAPSVITKRHIVRNALVPVLTTTALDVTTQAQIIELVRVLRRDFGTAVVWIGHDFGVIGQVADDVTVLRDGAAVEQAPALDVFDRPQHDYTRTLLEAVPPARPRYAQTNDRA